MLVDVHSHLYEVDADQAVAEAHEAGVGQIVVVSEDLESMEAVVDLKSRYPEVVLCGLGLHPALSGKTDQQALQAAVTFIGNHLEQLDLVGEVGLDYKWAVAPDQRQWQAHILDTQLELAAEVRKPVNLHSRRALRQTMDRGIEFHRRTGLGVLMHWFTHSKKLIRATNAEGIFVSVGPTVLHDEPTQRVAATISPKLLLLETDTPVVHLGDEARPCWIPRICEKMAQLLGVTYREIEERTNENFMKYMGLDRA